MQRTARILIVGSGPAGAVTALHLVRRAPGMAREIVVLEKARHPREKVCAGGLIPKVLRGLADLGLSLDVPHAVADLASVRIPGRRLTVAGRGLCAIVRRAEFDASLVTAARARGIEVREGEKVVGLARQGGGVSIDTTGGRYWAPIVVGADGAGSIVRRRLVGDRGGASARGLMCDVPLTETRWDGFAARRFDFDFEPVARGLRGYGWAFPCLIAGAPHVNVGVYSLPGAAALPEVLRRTLALYGCGPRPWHAFPIRVFDRRQPVSAPNVVLVGDAAGVDPLMGEGISFAFEYGALAAEAIVDALATGDLTLASYARAVAASPLGRKLARLRLAARLFYGPAHRLLFAAAARTPRGREVGLAWYSGTGGWEERSLWEAFRYVATGTPA
jgi:flavin-dependent dehydrogenase